MKKYLVKSNITIHKAISNLNNTGRKCLVVIDNNNKIIGTLSDGDVRKAISKKINLNVKIKNIMNKKPIFIFEKKYKLIKLKEYFINYLIDLIPLVNDEMIVTKIIFWEDLFDKKNKNVIYNSHINIPIIIMAGGKGTRLEPFTSILPKPLIPINGKVMIERILDNFSNFGFNNFNFVLNYKSLILKAYLKEMKSNVKINFYEEKKELGTVGGLFFLKNKIKDNFILSNCDIIVNCDYNDLLKTHNSNKNIITIVTASKEFVVPYGNCILNNNGELEYIDEKPKLDFLINTGIYIINKKAINFIKKNKKLNMDQLISIILEKKMKIGVFPVQSNQWIDIGEWPEYKKALEKFND